MYKVKLNVIYMFIVYKKYVTITINTEFVDIKIKYILISEFKSDTGMPTI